MNVMFSHLLKVYFFIHTDWDSQSFILNKFLLWSLRLTYGQSLLEQSLTCQTLPCLYQNFSNPSAQVHPDPDSDSCTFEPLLPPTVSKSALQLCAMNTFAMTLQLHIMHHLLSTI